MTPKMFVIDTLKSSLFFIGGAIYTYIWIISSFESWWLWNCFMFTVAVLANVLMPTFMGLFNKFTPIGRSSSKGKYQNLWNKLVLKMMVSLSWMPLT